MYLFQCLPPSLPTALGPHQDLPLSFKGSNIIRHPSLKQVCSTELGKTDLGVFIAEISPAQPMN